jgi:MFS family permease
MFQIWTTAIVLLAVLIDAVGYSIITPVMPFISTDNLVVALFLAAYAAGILILSPLIGIWSDKMGSRKPLFLASLFSLFLGTALFAFVPSLAIKTAARFIQGAGSGCIWTLGLSLMSDTLEPNVLSSAISFVFAAYTSGTVLGPTIGGVLFDKFGFLSLSYLMFALIGLCFFLLLFYSERKLDPVITDKNPVIIELNPNTPTESSAHSLTIQSIPTEMTIPPNDSTSIPTEQPIPNVSKQTPKLGLLDLIKNKKLAILLFAVFSIGLSISIVDVFVPIYCKNVYQLKSEQIGLVLLSFGLPNVVLAPFIGMLYNRLGVRMMLFGFLFAGIVMPFSGLNLSLVLFVTLITIASCGMAIAAAPSIAAIGDNVPQNIIGFVYGIFNVSLSLGMFLGPLLGTLIYGAYLWLGIVICCSVFLLASAAALFFYK